MELVKTLEWMIEAGVNSATQNSSRSYFGIAIEAPKLQKKQDTVIVAAIPQQAVPKISSASLSEAISEARKAAESAKNLAELQDAVNKFDGCALKKTANKTVFADGNPATGVMLIGEAPGADEDVQGIPFCGASGKLLDKVLFSIGLTRKDGFYITNTLFWRPPGNRKPTPEELAICEPFLEKHIALVNPKVLLLVGATAVQGVLKNSDAMAKLRGKSFEYKNQYMENPVPVLVTYHPSFLLRSPLNKRLAWEDMLFMQAFLKGLSTSS